MGHPYIGPVNKEIVNDLADLIKLTNGQLITLMDNKGSNYEALREVPIHGYTEEDAKILPREVVRDEQIAKNYVIKML